MVLQVSTEKLSSEFAHRLQAQESALTPLILLFLEHVNTYKMFIYIRF